MAASLWRYSPLAWALLGLSWSLTAPAAETSQTSPDIQLQRILENPFDLTLDKTRLDVAFSTIARKANIAIAVDEQAYEALPFGPTTLVSATFRAAPLRVAIEEILTPLGLEQSISGANLVIRPSKALARIGRRAMWEEIQLLQTLRKTQLTAATGDWTADLRTLLGKPDMIVQVGNIEPAQQEQALNQVRVILPCPVSRALDTYVTALGQLWCVQGNDLQIMPSRKWVERQLDRPLVIQMNNATLQSVVTDLSHLSGLRIEPQPGLYQAIPTVSLNSLNGSVRQTLDVLSGATGIAYEIKEDHVFLRLASTPTPASRDAIIGRIALPTGPENLTLEFFVRESDLPADLLEMRKKRLAETLTALQRQLHSRASDTRPAETRP